MTIFNNYAWNDGNLDIYIFCHFLVMVMVMVMVVVGVAKAFPSCCNLLVVIFGVV
jgi:hypothetical protein